MNYNSFSTMQAQANARIPKMTEVEGVMLRGTPTVVEGLDRPSLLARFVALLRRMAQRPTPSAKAPVLRGQNPHLSGR